ncbi:hypothetical protein [Caldicellulosiruptor sp. F32]|nr:hypothetical protein [Caldicellulosiruptor sp. F32]
MGFIGLGNIFGLLDWNDFKIGNKPFSCFGRPAPSALDEEKEQHKYCRVY